MSDKTELLFAAAVWQELLQGQQIRRLAAGSGSVPALIGDGVEALRRALCHPPGRRPDLSRCARRCCNRTLAARELRSETSGHFPSNCLRGIRGKEIWPQEKQSQTFPAPDAQQSEERRGRSRKRRGAPFKVHPAHLAPWAFQGRRVDAAVKPVCSQRETSGSLERHGVGIQGGARLLGSCWDRSVKWVL